MTSLCPVCPTLLPSFPTNMTTSLLTPFPSFTYHPHQVEGIQWMLDREIGGNRGRMCRGGILADEMGLGKTWQTIGLLLNNPLPNTLILVPPVLQTQWAEALAQAGIPHTILQPKNVLRKGAMGVGVTEHTHIAVTLATYDRAARAAEMLQGHGFDRIIADEGHVFRNGDSTKRFRDLSAIEATYRWILSGTPVQNNKNDLHNLCKWLGASYDRLTTPLSAIAQAIMLRRTVADVREAVQDFPEAKPLHIIHPVTMSADSYEKTIFDRLVNRFNDAVERQVANWVILELYLRIRQFLAHPQIYVDAMQAKYKAEYERKVWESSASKMDAFKTLMSDTLPPEPTLVFTSFRGEMAAAQQRLEDAGYTVYTIAGGMGDGARDAAIKQSRKAVEELGHTKVAMVVQIQAGNAGLNLQHFTRVFFMSSHWNPSVVDQAVGRSYRIGQVKQVQVHHILLADGAEKNLDRHMARVHRKKRLLAKAIHAKLVCDSAVEAKVLFETLNLICADEAADIDEEAEEAAAERAANAVAQAKPEPEESEEPEEPEESEEAEDE